MTESVLRLRVWPTDIDLNFHLNDGRYVSISGLGRLDVMLRTRLLRRALKRGWYPVVGSVVVRYRREIRPFEKFELHSRILGWDDKWFYFEHRFEKGGDVAALAYARGVMRTHGGAVPTSDVLELVDVSYLEDEILRPDTLLVVREKILEAKVLGDVRRLVLLRDLNEATRILNAIREGDLRAANQLLPLVYDELRQLAAQKLAHEKPGQTLQSTALVREAMRLNESKLRKR